MGIEEYVDDLNTGTSCEVKAVSECLSQHCKVAGRGGNVIVKLPVVISRCKISININARLKFDRYLIDIRDCRRDVKLVSCRLLDMNNGKYGKIFLEGYINERIEYIDAGCNDGREFSGVLRFLALKIPFEGTTRIDYCQAPLLKQNKGFQNIIVKYSNYHEGESAHACGMYCEVENAEISASTTMGSSPIDSSIFNEADECISASLTILILQEQLVNIY